MEITLSSTDLFLIIATVSVIVLMFFVVPLLVQLKKTAQLAEKLMEDLDRDIPAILSSMKVAASEMENLAGSINRKVEETDEIFRKIQYAARTLSMTGKILRSALVPAVVEVAGIGTGITAFLHAIHRSKSKEKEEVQTNE